MGMENQEKKWKKLSLKLPKQTSEERMALEKQLFEAGARYEKFTISAEKSNDGKEHTGKSWYVWVNEDTDRSPFQDYIKEPAVEKVISPSKSIQQQFGELKVLEQMDRKEILKLLVECDKKLHNGEISLLAQQILKEEGYGYHKGEIVSQSPVPNKTATIPPANRIYFKIPHMNKQDFEATVEHIKQNGGRFDAKKKSWYISDEVDKNNFKSYLDSSEQLAEVKDSVREKLQQNKENVEEPEPREHKEPSVER